MGDASITEAKVTFSLQSEARTIFESILNDARLDIPEEVLGLADNVQFVGEESQPFYPTPYKAAESQSAILGLVAVFAIAIAKDRYNIVQKCHIDVDHALLNGLGALFARHEGEWLSGSPKMIAAVQRWDHGRTRELYRQLATNIYKSKDGRWYSLHGNMDPTPLLTMLNVPQHNENDLSWGEILDMYAKIVGDIDSETLDNWSNNVYRTPGTVCLEQEEFLATPHVQFLAPYRWRLRLTSYTGPSDQRRAILQSSEPTILSSAGGVLG